jgi:probable blue pigment (indigoidine) exporter
MPSTPRLTDILLTAIAPAIWGSTYIVTTELLPPDYPMTAALLRALPAGLLLLAFSRQLPTGQWWWKVFVLGALNISIFWWLLFIAAYRLPGGIAAVVGAIQPLIVVFVSHYILGSSIRLLSIFAAALGTFGVALLILTPAAGFDLTGIIAGLGGALSMACGVVLTRKWQPQVSLLTFTGWQLAAGGVLLLPAALIWEPPLPELTSNNIVGFIYLGLIGSAVTYSIWFRGIARLTPNIVSPLGFLSPTTAVLLGWLILGQQLQLLQLFGFLMVFISIILAATLKPEARDQALK